MRTRPLRIAAVPAALAMAVLLTPTTGLAARGKPLRTGQATTFGSPGDTTAGLDRSYVDNGKGYVKDQRTGLLWEKKTNDGSIHDRDNQYSWSTGAPWSFNGTAATVFLAALNTQPCFEGFCDWRLPTHLELLTLVDLGTAGPAIAAPFRTACPQGCTSATCSCSPEVPRSTWTSSTILDSYATQVDFNLSIVGFTSKTDTARVRAVRNLP